MPTTPTTTEIGKGCFNETTGLGKFNETTGLGQWAVLATLMSVNTDGTTAWFKDLGAGSWSAWGYVVKLFPSSYGSTDIIFINRLKMDASHPDFNITMWRLDINGNIIWRSSAVQVGHTAERISDIDLLGNIVLKDNYGSTGNLYSVAPNGTQNWLRGGQFNAYSFLGRDGLNNVIESYTVGTGGGYILSLTVANAVNYFTYLGSIIIQHACINKVLNKVVLLTRLGVGGTWYMRQYPTTSPVAEWSITLPVTKGMNKGIMEMDSIGNAIVFIDTSAGNNLFSVNSTGGINWSIPLTSNVWRKMEIGRNDDIFLCGTAGVTSYSNLGVFIWSTSFVGETVWDVAVDKTSGAVYVLVGPVGSTAFPRLYAYNSAGVQQWSKLIHSHDIWQYAGYNLVVGKMVVHPSGNILIPLGRKYY